MSVSVLVLLMLLIIFLVQSSYRRDRDFNVYDNIIIHLGQFDERGTLVYTILNSSEYTLEYLVYRDLYLDIFTDEGWIALPEREFTEMAPICHYFTVLPGEEREVFHVSVQGYQVTEAGKYRFRMNVAVEDRSGLRDVRIGNRRQYMHEVIIAEFQILSVGDDNGGWEVELVRH